MQLTRKKQWRSDEKEGQKERYARRGHVDTGDNKSTGRLF
jgi:hypothetical protein